MSAWTRRFSEEGSHSRRMRLQRKEHFRPCFTITRRPYDGCGAIYLRNIGSVEKQGRVFGRWYAGELGQAAVDDQFQYLASTGTKSPTWAGSTM